VGDPGEVVPPFAPAPLRLRSLVSWQYRNAVRDLLGDAAAAAVVPPPDSAVNGLDAIGAAQLALSAEAVDKFEKSAYLAAQAALAVPSVRATLVSCTPSAPDDAACLEQLVTSFGRRAWRRPLSSDEVAAWTAIGRNAGAAYQDFTRGAEFVIAGLLQSPNFLHQVEVGEVDPAQPDRVRLTGFELATRMAFFLTGSGPSVELLEAAEAGELSTAEGLRARAAQLLTGTKPREALGSFFDELLRLRDLSALAKDAKVFPSFSPELASAMREETRLLLDNAVWEGDVDFRSVFEADYTYVNQALAAHYQLPAPSGAGFARVVLPAEQQRAGVLAQASFLSLMAHPASNSPTLRGKFIRESLLCQQINAPPAEVDTSLPASEGDPTQKTLREKLAAHMTVPSCASCHLQMDGLGLGFESFDATGRHRTTELGKVIDATGNFDGSAFDGAKQLGGLLAKDARVARCLTRSLFRAATGHVELASEELPLREVDARFAASGHRLKQLLIELVASDAFRYGAREEVSP
jgi:hypothetical protein